MLSIKKLNKHWASCLLMMMMMMMMMMTMVNCFCGKVDRRKVFSLISSQDHCQRPSPLWISNTPWAGFKPVQNLSSGLVEWTCAIVITTKPQRLWYPLHHYTQHLHLQFENLPSTLSFANPLPNQLHLGNISVYITCYSFLEF